MGKKLSHVFLGLSVLYMGYFKWDSLSHEVHLDAVLQAVMCTLLPLGCLTTLVWCSFTYVLLWHG